MYIYSDFQTIGIQFFLTVFLALYFIPAAPGFQARKFNWQNDVRVPLKNDEPIEILPSFIPVPFNGGKSVSSAGSIDTAYVKSPSHKSKFGDRESTISAINWSKESKSNGTDSLGVRNLDFEDKAVRIREKTTKVRKDKVNGKKILGCRNVTGIKVGNEKTRPRKEDQGRRVIRIELPSGDQRHSRNKEKLYLANYTASIVNVAEGNSEVKNKRKSLRIKAAGLDQNEDENAMERERNVRSTLQGSKKKRNKIDESYNRERVELEKITLQFKHLLESRKKRFCSYLRKDAIKDPLEMLMALLGTVYSESGEDSGVHWDRARGTMLRSVRDRITRQKLILNWACEDRRQGKNLIFGDAVRSINVDEQEMYSQMTRDEHANTKPRDPRLIVKPISTRHLFEVSDPIPQQGSPCQPNANRVNLVTELHEAMSIHTDQDRSEYQN